MKTYKLTEEDKRLIEIAKETIVNAYRKNHKTSTTNAAVILTKSKRIYRGVNIEVRTSNPISICAETGAIASMVTDSETEIKTVVTVWLSPKKSNNWGIIPPCGACRHFLSQFGNPFVILSENKKVRLKSLYPMETR